MFWDVDHFWVDSSTDSEDAALPIAAPQWDNWGAGAFLGGAVRGRPIREAAWLWSQETQP